MTDMRSFQRFAAIVAIVSFLAAMASNVLQAIPVHFNTQFPIDPMMFLSAGNPGGNLLRAGLILDMLGYYLPFLPIALFLQYWLRPKSPLWVRFFTACGIGYIFIGAVGAVTMAVIQPPLIQAYAQVPDSGRYALELLFGTIWNIIYAGLWNILAVLLVGIWFTGMGLLLRSERSGPAILALIVGFSALADSAGNMLGFKGLAMVGLILFLLLAPIWMLWFGIDLLRKPVEMEAAGKLSMPGING
jgi:hypothetical protein